MATTSTPTPIGQLRQHMQHDMMMRGLLPRTQDLDIRFVRRFAAFLGRPPGTATAENLRNVQIRPHEGEASAGTINGAVSALRFLYTVTLKRRDLARSFHRIRHYGLLAGSTRKACLTHARRLLNGTVIAAPASRFLCSTVARPFQQHRPERPA